MDESAGGVLKELEARLSALSALVRDGLAGRPDRTTPERDHDDDLHALAQGLLRERQDRKGFLPPSLFHEPAWELLLSLYAAHGSGTPLNVKHLVSLVDAPVTTSQRWIDQLVHMKLLHRVIDPVDRRRLEISLTDGAAEAMERYLRTLLPASQN